jgi:hypothetical protein
MIRTTRPLRHLVLGLGLAALLAAIAAPARADDDDWRHERREHEWRERQAWCAYHPYQCGYPGYYVPAPPPVVYAPPPPVVYAPPPPVVYAPPPVVYPPAGLSIVVPIHIR